MKTHDLVELASRNLRESILRNGLTTAGIGVGVASLVAMLSLGVGLQELASARLSRSGLFDSIVVSQLRNDRERDRDEPEPVMPADEPRILNESARREMERIPNVLEVQPEIRFVSEVRWNDKSRVTQVGGLAQSAAQTEAFETIQGKFFSSIAARETILQKEFAEILSAGQPGSLIGQQLVLRYAERQQLAPEESDSSSMDNTGEEAEDRDYGFTLVRKEQSLRIVGILDQEPFGGLRQISRSRVFIPNALAEELNIAEAGDLRGVVGDSPTEKTYSTLMVQVTSPTQVAAVQDSIHRMGYRTFSILDATSGLRRFFAILDLFLGIFGSLALAVASLGIINTLVMAVLERRREIGIMKAIGASDQDVKKLFFAEAGALGFAGGIAGVCLAAAIGLAINVGTSIYLERQGLEPEKVWSSPWWLLAAAVLFSVVVSLISGLYPAARAAKLDPVKALRYE
ncbi:MAG: hypothetical protein A3F68_09685 [Acidobacteria bacterium RIFCSPLOWO2_12_FULL_54_10]|nr:MAG: hypothetical protein A3F68_09685 [Acidobacteria bacterium RIFCSPLOWO2_12_FULL_54_10]